jgi:hypothetical protein
MHDTQAVEYVERLVGLQLSIARRMAQMRDVHFGPIRQVDGGSTGSFVLQIQCAWRIEGGRGIVTGTADLYQPADLEQNLDWEHWNYDTEATLQDAQLHALLAGYDSETASIVNDTPRLVVKTVKLDKWGGATIALSGGYRLVLFPTGTRGEDWRLFQPRTNQPHLVSAAGVIGLE